MNALYTAEKLIKYYPKSNFKLEIPAVQLAANTITGVVGENGNGKTTLLNIIAGNLSVDSGNYSYFTATPKSTKDWERIKDRIGFIPQRIPKWYGTLLQNLQLKAAVEKIPTEAIDNELDTLLDFLGLSKYKHLKWTEISTGYRLRFELARILIGNPELLVLDEPIANLDINAQQQFLSDLKSIAQERNVAVILSSQQLHEIETVADQMIFIKAGKAVFSGNISTLETATNTIEVLVKDEAKLLEFLANTAFTHEKRGVYYQIQIGETLGNEFLYELIQKGIQINYYRDISKSTKKLF